MSGKLMMNGLVMYDHQTDSLWSQVTGRGISGDFDGTTLRHMAALQTTWASWLTEHPETLVLDKLGSPMYTSDPYTSYYQDNSAGLFGRSNMDARVEAKQFVIGVTIDDAKKAYPFSELEKTPVLHDVVAGKPVLVVFDVTSSTGVVFQRTVEGRELTFKAVEHEHEPAVIIDKETGTRWSSLTGRAMDGPLEGTTLPQLPSTSLFWFAWSDFYPNTGLYTAK